MPGDARLERDVDVRYETLTLDDLLVSTAGASLRLVILDACRNNPLARSMQRTAASRSVSGGSFGNLNEDLLGDETLVAYAAAAGTTAADGRGRNSPYTSALLSHLETPLEKPLPGGFVLRLRRDTPGRNTTSASCMGTAAACGRTTRKPSDGTDAPPNRDTPAASTTSASCMRTAAASGGTAWKPLAGTNWRPSKETLPRRNASNAFGEAQVRQRGGRRDEQAGDTVGQVPQS